MKQIKLVNIENVKSTGNNDDKVERQEILITGHNEPKEFVDTKNIVSGMKEIGRNDPCPCGAINPATGQVYKWKKCGMIGAPQHRKYLIN